MIKIEKREDGRLDVTDAIDLSHGPMVPKQVNLTSAERLARLNQRKAELDARKAALDEKRAQSRRTWLMMYRIAVLFVLAMTYIIIWQGVQWTKLNYQQNKLIYEVQYEMWKESRR